jgi:uncharacterized damage-inducible protein DinB
MMDAIKFFLDAHHSLHCAIETGLWSLNEDQLRSKYREDVNSVAWLLWHMARCEDVGVNRLVADRQQVLHDGDWNERMGLDLGRFGTGMSDDEVSDFSQSVDLEGLRGYQQAVGQRTVEVVQSLRPDELDVVVDADLRRQVYHEEGVWTEAPVGTTTGRTRGRTLAHLALTHSEQHMGAAMVIAGLQGVRQAV